MADIHIRRSHDLGLAKARKTAWKWAEAAEAKFGMECTVIEGEISDVVEFTRSGVDGRLLVAADSFELTARLGLLAGVFRDRIESEIGANLDAMLAKSGVGVPARGAAAKKNAAAKKSR